MRILEGVADLAAAVGDHLGPSPWQEVGVDRIEAFADVTGDHQWIHVDHARAAAGPFGSTIAHGYLTLSLIPSIVAELYRLHGIAMRVNYGLDRVRFPAPLPAGSRVRGELDLLELTDTARGPRLKTRVTIEAEAEAKPVCVAEILTLIVP